MTLRSRPCYEPYPIKSYLQTTYLFLYPRTINKEPLQRLKIRKLNGRGGEIKSGIMTDDSNNVVEKFTETGIRKETG